MERMLETLKDRVMTLVARLCGYEIVAAPVEGDDGRPDMFDLLEQATGAGGTGVEEDAAETDDAAETTTAQVAAKLEAELSGTTRFAQIAAAAVRAVAPTKVVRFIDRDGAVVWASPLSPQDAQDRVMAYEDLGLEVLGVVEISTLPRKPTWPLEYEDPQCYMEGVMPREDLANFNIGTAETRMELIAAGHSPAAVIRATSAGFAAPTMYVH